MMKLLPERWKKLQDLFWAGPDYLRAGEEKKIIHFATVASSYWAVGLIRRKFTVPAILLMPAVIVILLYSLVIIDSLMLEVVYLLLAVIAVTWIAGIFFRLRGTLTRHLPLRVRAGAVFRIQYSFRNRRSIPAFDVVSDPFRWSPLLDCISRACLPRIGGKEVLSMTSEVRALRRGITTLYRPIAESAYPLGLLKWSVRGLRRDRLVIYPDFTSLAELHFPRGIIRRSCGAAVSNLTGESPDLLGSRDFRTGDAVRHIDWPGSARRGGQLVVKEFAREEFPEIAILADCCPPKRNRTADGVYPELEAAMSLAAAAAEKLLRQSSRVPFLAAGHAVERFPNGNSMDIFDAVCDTLAGVGPEVDFAAAELQALWQRELAGTEAALILMLDNTPDRVQLVRRLVSSGAGLKVILVNGHPSSPDIPDNWGRISPRDVFAGKITVL